MSQTCPECHGQAERFVPVFVRTADGKPPSAEALEKFGRCTLCGGLGVISDEQAAWYADGQRMSEFRIKTLRQGLRSAAELLGMLPSTWADMEHGCIKPVWPEEWKGTGR